MRERLAGALVLLVLLVCGCENPDFSGVRFKPLVRDPNAFKTAIKGYVFKAAAFQPAWGNEFLFHGRSPAERDLAPAVRATIVLDEATTIVTDATGLFVAEGLAAGFHSLKLELAGQVHPALVKLAKDHLTLVVFVLEDGGRLVKVDTTVAHTFVTMPLFKELLSFRAATRALVDRYARARTDGAVKVLTDLLAPDYADAEGGRDDLIKALRARGETRRPLEVSGLAATLGPAPNAGTVVVRVKGEAAVDFQRIDLKTGPTGEWRITAIME
jgi:hypothetical protein